MASPVDPRLARRIRFGPYELDTRSGELLKHGVRLLLREQPLRILILLLDHPGELVTREEIRGRLWPSETIVEFDRGINTATLRLRQALGETAKNPNSMSSCGLYSDTAQPQNLWPNPPYGASGYSNIAWNGNDPGLIGSPPGTPPAAWGSSNSSKPDLQALYLSQSASVAGQIVDAYTGTGGPQYDPTGWFIFLNYYFWMQGCLDYQIGEVLGTNMNSNQEQQPGLQYAQGGKFWNNTVIIFTSDHGEYGGSHGLHAKGGALYDEIMNVPLYISFPNSTLTGRQASHPPPPLGSSPTGGIPISFTCSSVDILPFIYTLALGNESWRCDNTDIINYLNGRESIMDAIMGGSAGAVQRRLATFPQAQVLYPRPGAPGCPGRVFQPYVLHTNDEYFYYNKNNPNLPPHAVAFRTVDATVSGIFSETGPFGGGKLGIYSNWYSNLSPVTDGSQQFEFYNYEPNAYQNDGVTPLALNSGEIGNDYWTSQQSLGQAYAYVTAYNPSPGQAPYQTGELAVIYPQIQIAYANAFNLWQRYSIGANPASPHAGITCNGNYFTVSASAVSIQHGNAGMLTVTIGAPNGFSSSVSLTVTSALPTGVTVSLNPATVSPVPGSSIANITVDSSVMPGKYYITITATGATSLGTLTQIAVIVLTVT